MSWIKKKNKIVNNLNKISYEILCEQLRIPPIIPYFENLIHPVNILE
jgi:hypothetical protein